MRTALRRTSSSTWPAWTSSAPRARSPRPREPDIGRIAPGQTIPVTIDARPELGTIEGPVEEMVPSADPATHSFTVKVGLPGAVLPSGLSGRAQITGAAKPRL